MPFDLSKRHSYVTACVRYHDLAYTSSQDDAVPPSIEHSHFHELDGDNLGYVGVVHWATVSMTVTKKPFEQMLALSPQGDVKLFGSGRQSEEKIATRAPLRKVRTIRDQTYAVGMGRQVFLRTGENQWRELAEELRPGPGEVKGFEAIDGFALDDLYAAGWDGELWHFDGGRWTRKRSPTTNVVTSLVCAGDGRVYGAAQGGALLRGRGDEWEKLDVGTTVTDLAWFGDALFVASPHGLFTLTEDTLQRVDFGSPTPETFGTLSSADGVLWSIGRRDLVAYDARAWRTID